jgi:sodium-dependent dicarboxylate transporter 2/3/5
MTEKGLKLNKKTIGLLLGIVASASILLFTDLEPGNRAVTTTMAVTVLMAIWWVTEAIPLAVTALVPVVLFPFLGIMDGKVISSAYFNHIIFLFIGGFIMALAMEKWNLHKRIALKILIFIGVSPGRILLGFMLATSVLSMWISNTATTMMMIPIVLSVVFKLEESLGKKSIKAYSAGLFLGVAYSSSIGGLATLVGTPTNLICVRILDMLFPGAPEISFATWFFFALPITVVMFGFAWLVIYFIYRPKEKWKKIDDSTFREQYRQLGKISYEQKVIFILFLSLALLWIFRADIVIGNFRIPGWSGLFQSSTFLNDGTVAVMIAVLLFILPAKQEGKRLMDWKTATRLPWNIVLLFGGGFALALGFESSGLDMWFGEQLEWTQNINPFLILLIILTTMSLLTELTSNVASTQMLLPAYAALAISSGNNPLLFMIPVTLASSLAFMLPTATPSNAIVFGTDRVSIPQMIRTGFILNFIGVLIVLAYTYLAGGSVFEIEPGIIPDWAEIK